MKDNDDILSKEDYLKLITSIALKFVTEKEFDSLLNLMVSELKKILSAERVTILLYDEDQQLFWSKVTQEKKSFSFSADRGIAGRVANTKKLINIKDAYSDPDFNPEVDLQFGFKTRNILAVPLLDNENKLIGVLQALNKITGDEFTKEDERISNILSKFMAVALTNHRNYQQVSQLERAKTHFLGIVSHELRTPLNPILGILNSTSIQISDKTIELMRKSANRLNDVINKIIELAEIDTKTSSLNIEKIKVENIIKQAIQNASNKQAEYNIIIREEIDDTLFVYVDFIKFKEVIISIIDNAIQFSDGAEYVDVKAFEENNSVYITIRDYGIGIEPDKYYQVFSRFEQASNINTHNKGIALSMPLCRQIVNVHNGKLYFKSRVGDGTTFYIRLPAERTF